MNINRNFTRLEKFFCSLLVMFHIVVVTPIAEIIPVKKEMLIPEAHAVVNHPPVIFSVNNIAPVGNQIAITSKIEGDTLILDAIASDPDGDLVNITFGEPFDENGFWQIPYNFIAVGDEDMIETVTATVTASDGQDQTSVNVNIDILDKDATPHVEILLSEDTVGPNEEFNIHVDVSDPDIEVLPQDIIPANYEPTYHGDAHLDANSMKFGTSSLGLDGSGDYLSVPDSDDWYFADGDFTIDFWVKMDSVSNYGFIAQRDSNGYGWRMHLEGNYIQTYVHTSSYYIGPFTFPWSPQADTWYHVAYVRSGNDFICFIDGTQIGTTRTNSQPMPNINAELRVGAYPTLGGTSWGDYLNGNIDELRVSKGIARWTSNFTPPQASYTPDTNTKLLLHLDDPSIGGDSLPEDYNATYYGQAHLDAGQKKFGASSLYLDGQESYVSYPDSDDWYFESGDFTIEAWVRAADVGEGQYDTIAEQYVDNSHRWLFYLVDGNISFFGKDQNGNTLVQFSGAHGMTENTWHHVAVARSGSDWTLYVDGDTKAQATQSGSMPNFSSALYTGVVHYDDLPYKCAGAHIDELRVSKGVARWLTDFTPPETAYESPDSYTKILLHFDVPEDYNYFKPALTINGEPIVDVENIPSSIYGNDSFDVPYSIEDPGAYTITAKVMILSTGQTFESSKSIEVLDPSLGNDDIFPVSGDFNADGIQDIGTWNKFDNSWKVAFSSGGSFNSIKEFTDIFGTPSYHLYQTYPLMGDFNGDSLTDIAIFDNNAGTWKFAFNDGDTFTHQASLDLESFGGDLYAPPLTGDFNGDGITDIGFSNGYNNDRFFTLKLTKKGGYGFEDAVTIYREGLEPYRPYSADVNADGLMDVVLFKKTSGDWKVMLSRGQTASDLKDYIQDSATTVTGDSSGNTTDGDFDTYIYSSANLTVEYIFQSPQDLRKIHFKAKGYGDSGTSGYGRVMVELYYGGSWHKIYSFQSEHAEWAGGDIITSGSWDDVEKMRVFADGSGTYKHAYIYEAQAFGVADEIIPQSPVVILSEASTWLSDFGQDDDPVIKDFNFDGKTDVGYFDKDSGNWYVALSKGSYGDGGFEVVSGSVWPSEGTGWPYAQSADNDSVIPMGGDISGDAIGDALAFDKSKQGVLNKWKRKLHNSKLPDLLIGIQNGIGGGTTQIEYTYSTRLDNTGADGDPGTQDLPFPVRVVTKVTKTDGMGNSYATGYNYRDGYFETGSREFRGFGYVRVTDPEGHYKETFFHQDDIFKGRPSTEVVYDKYNRKIQEVDYSWDFIQYHSGKTTFPYLDNKTATLYDYKTGELKEIGTSHEYDQYGNATKIRDEGFLGEDNDERETNITYEYNVAKWIVSKPLTSETTGTPVVKSKYTYDDNGALTKEEKWLDTGSRWIATDFTYDAHGNVATVTDALGRTTTTAYEATKTFPASVANALGHSQSFTYDNKTGKILTSTDPNGQVTTSEYDGFGRLTKVTGPGGISEVTYTYILTSQPVQITTTTKTSDIETVTSYSYMDGLGRKIETITEADDSQYILSGIVKYDSRGQVIEKYLPTYTSSSGYIAPTYSGKHVKYAYDPLGRVTQTIRPDSKVSYNTYSITTQETRNENSQTKEVTKDAYGRILTVKEANGNETHYEYDLLGNLTKTTDAVGNINTIAYDSLGRKISMVDADMGSWNYSYSDAGNLISQTDAKGDKLLFEYDNINRLTKKSSLRGGGEAADEAIYTYDQGVNNIGRLSRVDDHSGTTQFFYDILGREIKTTKTVDSTGYTIERQYDALDRLTSVKYPDQTEVTYTYNKQGGIKKVGIPGDDDFYVTDIAYNVNGQIISIEYANGTSSDYTYDEDNLRLSALNTKDYSLTTIQSLSYQFDPVGNVTQITDTANGNSQSFSYDNLNRLIQAQGTHYGTQTYEYDAIGNMTKKGTKALVYGEGSAGPHAVTTYDTTTITYDDNGNMLTKGDTSYTFDQENRLTKVSIPKLGEVTSITLDFDTTGWHYVSLPYRSVDISGTLTLIEDVHIATLLSDIDTKYDQVTKYDTQTSTWKHFVNNPEYDDFSSLEYGEGYQIYINTPCSIEITGIIASIAHTKDLYQGQNLIFSPTDTAISVDVALGSLNYTSIKYDNESEYIDVSTLEAGKSYWLEVSSNQTWNIQPEKTVTDFVYDGDGGRVKRETPEFTTIYIGNSYEITIDNTTTEVVKSKKNIFLGSSRACEVVEEDSEIHAYFVHADHIGSSNILTDETGQRVSLFEYKPFGSLAYADESNTYDTDKRFNGRTYDTSTGLVFYGGRYYLPDVGRWLTADPTVQHPYDPQNLNRYSFLQNNPVNGREINGYGFWSWLKKAWKAIAAVAIVAVTLVIAVAAPQIGIPMLQAEYTLGIMGGVSAAIQGGDIQQGVLFGVIAGATTGLALGAMGAAGTVAEGAHVWAAMAEGAVAGTAAGATTGYAGGKGSIQETIFWAAIGNVSTAVLYGVGAALKAANPSTQAVAKVGKESKDAFKPVAGSENEYTVNAVENAIDPIKAKEMRQARVLQKALLVNKTEESKAITGGKIIKGLVDIFKTGKEIFTGVKPGMRGPWIVVPKAVIEESERRWLGGVI